MKKIIHNLRQKPQAQKEQIAFWGALGVTLLIGIIWFTGLSGINNNSSETKMANVSSPFTELKSQINLIVKDFKEQIK